MIKIEFTDAQVEELKSFYVLELDKIQKRAEEISGLIAKLGVPPIALQEVSAIKVEKRAYVKKQKVVNLLPLTEVKKPKPVKAKRARRKSTKQTKVETSPTIIADNKPLLDWKKFIAETLIKQRRILTIQEFAQFALVYFELPKTEKKKVLKAVSTALSRSEKKDKAVKYTFKTGIKGRVYGLANWFDDQGQLISEYK